MAEKSVSSSDEEPKTKSGDVEDVELSTSNSKDIKKVKEEKPWKEPTHLSSIIFYFTNSYIITGLLIFAPIGITIGATHQNDTAVFIINFLAIVPLARLLGDATEELALHTNQTVGGLLNATFGNAVEIIIGLIALNAGLIRVVQSSLVGSILSNLLLVLGMCFIAGGIKYHVLKFNQTAAQTSGSILLVAVLGCLMPAALKAQLAETSAETANATAITTNVTSSIFNITSGTYYNLTIPVTTIPITHETGLTEEARLLVLSRGTAIIMLIVYGLFLFFQLYTHKSLYEDEGEHDEEDEENSNMTLPMCILMLCCVTAVVAVCSDYLVGSIDGITQAWGISDTFAGIVLLPIVGNAAEHLTAVTVSLKNKMDLALGVALGSSQQIAMMVIPLMVIAGWGMGQPMDLYFETFETAVLFMTVIVVNALIGDGESNWLEGAMLLLVYVILAIAFYVV